MNRNGIYAIYLKKSISKMQRFRLKPKIEFFIILQINMEAIQKIYFKKIFLFST